MTHNNFDTASMNHLYANADKGNLLSRFQLYQLSSKEKADTTIDHDEVNKQFCLLQDEAQKSRLHLGKLSLYSFRRYKNLQVEFDEHLTLIVGENGSGKTSIVDSIAKILTWFASRTIKANNSGSHIQDADIQTSAIDYAQIAATFKFNRDAQFDTSLVRPVAGWLGKVSSELQATSLLGEMYRILAASNKALELPVFAYYGIDRTSNSLPSTSAITTQKALYPQRFYAYSNVFRAQDKSKYFIQQYVVLSNRADYDDPICKKQLQLINQAIESAVPHISNLHIDRSDGVAKIKLDSFGNRINFSQLSQGQRTLASMVGDLALTMSHLNPHMDNPLHASGIVLVDEIDLHLHPSLQQKIIPNLQTTFKNLQWIITTHSPHVLSTVDKESIRIIEFDNEHHGSAIARTPVFQTKGVISSNVLEQIMETHAVPDVPESKWITDYQSLIQTHQWDSSEGIDLNKKLLQHFGNNHPVIKELEGLVHLEKLKKEYKS